MRKKNLILLFLFITSFFAGFVIHALFFPAVLTNNVMLYTKRALENKQVTPVENNNKSLTKVSYEDGQFDPQVVVIGKSYYIAITNMSSTEYMNLTSDNPLLTTPRDYGLSEEVRAQLYEPGVYTVSSKLHPGQSLKVIVR
ncbi:MAG: hypothetical protein NTZ55_01505 [Candidatus Roizmanbacteria bacterium]|nr:hypothetical protein [Candidatus Roizmanbacteria bacterium]